MIKAFIFETTLSEKIGYLLVLIVASGLFYYQDTVCQTDLGKLLFVIFGIFPAIFVGLIVLIGFFNFIAWLSSKIDNADPLSREVKKQRELDNDDYGY